MPDMSLTRWRRPARCHRIIGEIEIPSDRGAFGSLVALRALCYCSARGRTVEVVTMCDYSLHSVATRPAKVGDKLVTTQFVNCLTRGFCGIEEPNVAVCLLPGTEVAFENEIEFEGGYGI